MSLSRLCVAFRQLTLKRQSNTIGRLCSTTISKEQSNNEFSSNIPTNFSHIVNPVVHIKFVPRTLDIDFGKLNRSTRKDINELPLSKYIPSMEEPVIPQPTQQDVPLNKIIDFPSVENILEKLAVRLIVIRRRKMKKHKRKKLRKRMHFVWAKIRSRRNMLKEKLFQAEMVAKINKANNFDAKKYVEERLAILDKERIPKTYRGEILRPDMIRKFLQEEREKREKWLNRPRLTLN